MHRPQTPGNDRSLHDCVLHFYTDNCILHDSILPGASSVWPQESERPREGAPGSCPLGGSKIAPPCTAPRSRLLVRLQDRASLYDALGRSWAKASYKDTSESHARSDARAHTAGFSANFGPFPREGFGPFARESFGCFPRRLRTGMVLTVLALGPAGAETLAAEKATRAECVCACARACTGVCVRARVRVRRLGRECGG
jgi:hypothetical protein